MERAHWREVFFSQFWVSIEWCVRFFYLKKNGHVHLIVKSNYTNTKTILIFILIRMYQNNYTGYERICISLANTYKHLCLFCWCKQAHREQFYVCLAWMDLCTSPLVSWSARGQGVRQDRSRTREHISPDTLTRRNQRNLNTIHLFKSSLWCAVKRKSYWMYGYFHGYAKLRNTYSRCQM